MGGNSVYARSYHVQNDLIEKYKITHKPKLFSVNDPLYKKENIYEGYDFLTLLKENNIDISMNNMVIFEAKDGFKINIPLSYIVNYHPFLATRDHSLPSGKDWLPARDENRIVDGGPFYLMWNKLSTIPQEFWPFGIVKITLSSFKEAYGASAPTDTKNLKVMNGFRIFNESCGACHSVNGVGGKLGPEMNVPMNFTERYSKKYIIQYAMSPSAVAIDAKMPPYKSVSNNKLDSQKELELVIDYLEERKAHKICDSQKTCHPPRTSQGGNREI